MKIRNTIPLALLITLLFAIGTVFVTLLSGRSKEINQSFEKGGEDAQQQLQQQETVTGTLTPTSERQVENKNDLSHDLSLLTSLKAGLDEQYNIAKDQEADLIDSGWLADFNRTLRELAYRYRDLDLKTQQAESHISIAISDLRTLSQEYEKNLQGKDNDINYFSYSFEENINKAKEIINES